MSLKYQKFKFHLNIFKINKFSQKNINKKNKTSKWTKMS